MNRILVATMNAGKVAEIEGLVSDLEFEVASLSDHKDAPTIVEDADSFKGNALIKAETVCAHFDCPVLADDSGLEVDALDGRPGVHSARFGGAGLNDEGRYLKLLDELRDVPDKKRTARFRCAIAFARPGEESAVFFGTLEGSIARAPSGINGFGYDPVFVPEGETETLASLPISSKKKISHRAKALQAFVEFLQK